MEDMVFAVLAADFTTSFLYHAYRKMHKEPAGGLSNLACRFSGRNQQKRSLESVSPTDSTNHPASHQELYLTKWPP